MDCLTLVTEWPPAGCVLKSFDYLWLVIICMTPAFVFSMQDLFGHNTSSLHFDIVIYYQESPHLTFFLAAITELIILRWGASQDPTQLGQHLPNRDQCVRCSETLGDESTCWNVWCPLCCVFLCAKYVHKVCEKMTNIHARQIPFAFNDMNKSSIEFTIWNRYSYTDTHPHLALCLFFPCTHQTSYNLPLKFPNTIIGNEICTDSAYYRIYTHRWSRIEFHWRGLPQASFPAMPVMLLVFVPAWRAAQQWRWGKDEGARSKVPVAAGDNGRCQTHSKPFEIRNIYLSEGILLQTLVATLSDKAALHLVLRRYSQ